MTGIKISGMPKRITSLNLMMPSFFPLTVARIYMIKCSVAWRARWLGFALPGLAVLDASTALVGKWPNPWTIFILMGDIKS
jgi:hypothetical protein